MKSNITLLVISVLAAFALVGCNQNNPSSITDTSTTNSSPSGASELDGWKHQYVSHQQRAGNKYKRSGNQQFPASTNQ